MNDSVAAKTEDSRVLQDLSLNDAEELQAFVAKRKWFEVKLKELESHARIYPFVKVDLEISGQTSKVQTAHTDGIFDFTLPEVTQVRRWKEERDAVEEEVIAFDGGDLERMKQKTRAVTLIPLTPPSTELVEVTLDLIVVVDRLLTLLRKRSELLELTKLRLHWDELRMTCAEELDGMKSESDLIVARKCEWLPSGITSRTGHDEPNIPHSSPIPPPVPTTPRQRILSLPESPSHSRRSPGSTSYATPRRASLRIPLLRSQITNLRIRHTTFSTTVLPRVGALLDKMIDIAGPLKGLGDINGPMEEGTEGDGAVPGELLDAQDDLESRAAEIGRHVQWFQQLEDQCTRAEQLYLSLQQTRQRATNVVAKVVSIVEIDMDILPILRAEWEDALLPIINLSTDGSPEASEYPQNHEHEAQITQILEEASEAAQVELNKGRQGLDWLERLSEQFIVVDRCCNELSSREYEVIRLLDRIPDHDEPFQMPPHPVDQVLAAELEEWYTQTIDAEKERPNLYQQSTIAGMRYRALLNSPPPSLVDAVIIKTDVALTRLDDAHESTKSKTAELLEVRRRLLRDEQIGSLAAELHLASLATRTGLESTNSTLVQRIDLASWHGHHQNASISMEDIDAALPTLRDQISAELIASLRNLKVLVGGDGRYEMTLSVSTENVDKVQHAYQTASNYRELLGKTLAQTRAVDTIHDEADALLAKIPKSNLEPITLKSLEEEVTTWLDSIVRRIPFLASDLPKTPTDHESATVRRSGSPLAETSSPAPRRDVLDQLASKDQVVRDALNVLTSRVSSALRQTLDRVSGGQQSMNGAANHNGPQHFENRPASASSSSGVSPISTGKVHSVSTTSDLQANESNPAESPSKASTVKKALQLAGERSTRLRPRHSLEVAPVEPHVTRYPEAGDAVDAAVTPRPRYLSHAGVPRQSSRKSRTSAQQISPLPTPSATPESGQNESSPFTAHSGLPRSASRLTSRYTASLSSSVATPSAGQAKSASLGRAAGNLYSSRRAPSMSNGLDRLPVSRPIDRLGSSHSQREDRILARSTSMRSISLGRSSTNTPSSSRVLSASLASGSSQTRTPSSRYATPGAKKAALTYVPDPANKLDVAVGDIVNGFKVHVPIVPIGMTLRDEYKDTTGSYWIGAEGRAKLCFCRILRSQMVMVRVGGGWMELSKFLIDHFGGSAIEQSLSSLSLHEQSEDAPANLVTPIRPRVASSTAIETRTPDQANGSPRKEGETDGSPLTPLRFIKRASDSPDVRQKEKASLRIGRRSILGKE